MDCRIRKVEACYDSVASVYADKFREELACKPLDREMLNRLARRNRERGEIADLGCGPGHAAAYLAGQGCRVIGVDLSAEMVKEAASHYPLISFRQGNMLELDFPDGALAAIVSLYSIVNLQEDQISRAFSEMCRVLQPDGELLLSFHIGSHSVYVERFLEQEVALDFYFYEPDIILELLNKAGFERLDAVMRYPYADVEFASKRAYIHAAKKREG